MGLESLAGEEGASGYPVVISDKNPVIALEHVREAFGHLFANRALGVFHFRKMVLADTESIGQLFLRHIRLVASAAQHGGGTQGFIGQLWQDLLRRDGFFFFGRALEA